MQLRLNRSYNPIWFTNNELSQITPLPMAWDRTSISGPASRPDSGHTAGHAPRPGARGLPVPEYQAKQLSGYASSPIWSVVDGPWKLGS